MMHADDARPEAWVLMFERIAYNDAFALQRRLVDARGAGSVCDTFLLLEHQPVFTANRETTFSNILAPKDVLDAAGIEVCWTDRGGDVTYHGPGQIVGYNIMDLKRHGRDLHRYIRNVEQMIIDTLTEYDIQAGRDPQHPGVWVGNEKICAIGIAVKSGWITMHGFALNVAPDMDHYRYIIACGIFDKGVTSMSRVLGRTVELAAVRETIVKHYGRIFNSNPRRIAPEDLPWS
jgi:lipoate-protein ligase B